jgi:hypothetical protein
MIRLTDSELAGLDPIIESRKSAPDISSKKQENGILTDRNNTSIIIPPRDRVALSGGEGLSVEALMKVRQDSLK